MTLLQHCQFVNNRNNSQLLQPKTIGGILLGVTLFGKKIINRWVERCILSLIRISYLQVKYLNESCYHYVWWDANTFVQFHTIWAQNFGLLSGEKSCQVRLRRQELAQLFGISNKVDSDLTVLNYASASSVQCITIGNPFSTLKENNRFVR